MKKFQNLLFNDNVLCIAIEFDTKQVLDPDRGSLFAVIAETVPPASSRRVCRSRPGPDGLGRPSGADEYPPQQWRGGARRRRQGSLEPTDAVRDR